jgi:CRISPR-associated protein Cmr1
MRTLPKINGEVVAPEGELEVDLNRSAAGTPIVRQQRKYELITPLFGGGVEPGVNDEITPISGKSIRGHLRFWWRATRGGQFGAGEAGLRKMKEREAAIWGAASTPDNPSPSRVEIEVVLDSRPKIGNDEFPYDRPHHVNPGWNDRAYAAFPFQDDPHSVVRYKFTLKLSFPEWITLNDRKLLLSEETTAALWAWETFGGIGARTRRGFGALRTSESLPKEPEKVEEAIRNGLRQCVVEGEFPSGVPHLSQDLSFVLAAAEKDVQVGPNKVKRREAFGSYNDAWEALLIRLKAFRQARGAGFGRSKWNEPERIREITGQRLTRHTKNPDLADIESFPRVAFGQPILFQFHRDQKNSVPPYQKDRDPMDTTLKGGLISTQPDKYRERLASPLILRPIACGGTKAVGLAAILKAPRVAPEGLLLKGDGVNVQPDLTITRKDALKIEPLRNFASRLENDDDEVDVLEAFLDCFRTQEKKKK